MRNAILPGEFGSVRLEDGSVVEAPRFTRIPLRTIQARPDVIAIEDGCLTLAGLVSYRPIELDYTGMSLVCELVQDGRPLLVQAKDRTSRAPQTSDGPAWPKRRGGL